MVRGKAQVSPSRLVHLWLPGVLFPLLLLGFRGYLSAPVSLVSQEAPEDQWFLDNPSFQPLLSLLVALGILEVLDILFGQVVPSLLEDLVFLVVQALQGLQTCPCPGCQGLLLVQYHLFYLVVLSIHLSLEVLGCPWVLVCTSLGVLLLQVVQTVLGLLEARQAHLFLEFQGDLEVQGVQYLHFPQKCLFLLESLVPLVPQACLLMVLPWLQGRPSLQDSRVFPFPQDNQVILLFLGNLDLPSVLEPLGVQLLGFLVHHQVQDDQDHMFPQVQANQVDLWGQTDQGALEDPGNLELVLLYWVLL